MIRELLLDFAAGLLVVGSFALMITLAVWKPAVMLVVLGALVTVSIGAWMRDSV